MPGLVPGIHVFGSIAYEKTWMAGTKPGHDENESVLQAGKAPAFTFQPRLVCNNRG
jgi:hypothetical protein